MGLLWTTPQDTLIMELYHFYTIIQIKARNIRGYWCVAQPSLLLYRPGAPKYSVGVVHSVQRPSSVLAGVDSIPYYIQPIPQTRYPDHQTYSALRSFISTIKVARTTGKRLSQISLAVGWSCQYDGILAGCGLLSDTRFVQ